MLTILNKNIERIAKICHNVNASYCNAMGDHSQIRWELSPEWQRQSVIDGLIYHLNHPDATPEQSHNEWNRCKIKDGWKYGLVKDAYKKEHPCMVPYKELPKEQQAKDYIFKAIVDNLRGYSLIHEEVK